MLSSIILFSILFVNIKSNDLSNMTEEYNNLRFECYYNDTNDFDYYSMHGGLLQYSQLLQNAAFQSYESMINETNTNITFSGDILYFDICGIFNQPLTSNDPDNCYQFYTHDSQIN
eukprot:544647_1